MSESQQRGDYREYNSMIANTQPVIYGLRSTSGLRHRVKCGRKKSHTAVSLRLRDPESPRGSRMQRVEGRRHSSDSYTYPFLKKLQFITLRVIYTASSFRRSYL